MKRILLLIVAVVGFALEASADVILTRSGRLLEGNISVSETAVVVSTDTGPRVLPRADVVYRGATREDVYRELAKKARSVAKRLELAEWCLDNDLQAQALEQCDQAMKLSPGNIEAGRLMKRAREVGMRPIVQTSATVAKPKRPHGLSRNTMSHYTQRVLPLLTNACATAGCHNHASENEFAIRRNVYRGERRETLDSILKQIDTLQPSRSPLVTYAITPHGTPRRRNDAGKPPLNGRYAGQQLALITAWVTAAAAEMDYEPTASETPTDESEIVDEVAEAR